MNFKSKRCLFILPIALAVLISFGSILQKKDSDSSISPPSPHVQSENTKFDQFTDSIFFSQIAGDPLSRHFTINNLNNFLSEYARTHSENFVDFATDIQNLYSFSDEFGSFSYEEMKAGQSFYISQIKKLKSFDYEKLSDDRKKTYDIIMALYKNELDFGDLCLCYECLNPTTGFQAQLPVLLSEYTFSTKDDIENYFKLLKSLPSYFSQILDFEKLKYERGYFMADSTCREVIAQCKTFVVDNNAQNCILHSTFKNRISECDFLDDSAKDIYVNTNLKIISDYVFKAYNTLSDGLSDIIKNGDKSGSSENTLSKVPDGKDYYEYLVRSYTGSNRPVSTIKSMIQKKVSSDMTEISSILNKDAKLSGLLENEVKNSTPKDILSLLESRLSSVMNESMLSIPSYSVKYVDSSLEDFLSPAFYLSPPIDMPMHNVIYINQSKRFKNQDLYATLAHEGIPGHMYQNYIFSKTKPSLVRNILSCGGYTEGWATYTELLSYESRYDNKNISTVFSANASFSLGIYSLVDIGVNYEGWSLSDTVTFLSNYGLSNRKVAAEMFNAVIESPANYLQYYVGYLEILSLRDYYLTTNEGSTLKDFHKYFLEFGPAPFDVLEKWANQFSKQTFK